jgi:hypothetical protein
MSKARACFSAVEVGLCTRGDAILGAKFAIKKVNKCPVDSAGIAARTAVRAAIGLSIYCFRHSYR